MAIDYSIAQMANSVWPPAGDVTYPDKYANFITLNETAATELENAREAETSLVLNLQNNYLTSTLATDIVGNGFKFTGMLDGTNPSQDYATVTQVTAMGALGPLPHIDELLTDTFNVPYADFRVENSTDFGTFEYNPSSLSGTTFWYPSAFNKTYKATWGGTPILVNLDAASAPIPTLGDRLRFVFDTCGVNDGIQASSSLIHGYSEKITFGILMPHAIYDLVYTGAPTGWLFKNVILGA